MSAAGRAVIRAVLVAVLVTASTGALLVLGPRADAAVSTRTSEPTSDPATTTSPPPRGPLGLDPGRAVAGAVVQVAPCPLLPDDGGTFGLVLDKTRVLLGEDGRPAPYGPGESTSFVVPDGVAPGVHSVDTVAVPAGRPVVLCAPTPFTVLAAPSLAVDPARAQASASVRVSGTCALSPDRPVAAVALDGVELATPVLEPSGEFGPVAVTLPGSTTPGAHKVTTDCGGGTTLEILGSPVVTTTRPSTGGATGPSTGGSTHTDTASPAPSSVALTAAPGPPPGGTPPPERPVSWTRAVLLSLGALLVVAAALAVAAVRALRDRRGRQWVTQHVQLRPAAREALQPVAGAPPPGDELRIELRASPGSGWMLREGVQDADRRHHAADDAAGAALR